MEVMTRLTNFSINNEEKSEKWKESVENDDESLKVLDPDDPLMKRFQDALKAQLTKINERLSKDIDELTTASNAANKKREEKGLELYDAQRDIACQETAMDKYKTLIDTLRNSRADKEQYVRTIKETEKKVQQELDEERRKCDEMTRDIESLSSVCRQFGEFEEEIANHLAVAKRMSSKDASIQRELIRAKQEADYILLKASEQVWKMEKDLEDLKNQIVLKNDEKLAVCQTIADVDADLGAHERERKNLMDSWNRVVASILQRDKVYDELSEERRKMQESFKTLQARIEIVKKDTRKEMETNERLTTIQSRLEEEIQCNQASIETDSEKAEVLQCHSDTILRLMEQSEVEYAVTLSEHERLKKLETAIHKELNKLAHEKKSLEEEISSKLEDKVAHDKTVKSLNKSLRDTRETIDQMELTMLQTENNYGKCLLDVERLKNEVSIEKIDLDELIQINNEKEKELNKFQMEVEKCNLLIERKQKKISELNKKIDEKNLMTGEVDMSPQEIKIASLEKTIDEFETKNKDAQRHWLRQESVMVNLTQERNTQLQEINSLSKQIMIMEQKNLKLDRALENEKQSEQTIERRMNELHQRLQRTNAVLAEQRELRDNLRDKNFITKDEYTRTLQKAETELIKLQNNFKDLTNEKSMLEEKLREANREYLSWEKKVKLAAETTKVIKEAHNPGGDVAIMKSEIHKMEIRLSHLKKAQEKMIRDMEHCVSRREMIMDSAIAKEKKNPKCIHNRQVMFEKRMDCRRLKIKQIKKKTKNIETEIEELLNEKSQLEKEIAESQELLKTYESEIAEIDRQIVEGELIKHHKLECLVRKQRKIALLQKLRDGKYKTILKSEAILNEDMEKQRALNTNLIEIMEQTHRDFPLLKDDIKKILLTLQLS